MPEQNKVERIQEISSDPVQEIWPPSSELPTSESSIAPEPLWERIELMFIDMFIELVSGTFFGLILSGFLSCCLLTLPHNSLKCWIYLMHTPLYYWIGKCYPERKVFRYSFIISCILMVMATVYAIWTGNDSQAYG